MEHMMPTRAAPQVRCYTQHNKKPFRELHSRYLRAAAVFGRLLNCSRRRRRRPTDARFFLGYVIALQGNLGRASQQFLKLLRLKRQSGSQLGWPASDPMMTANGSPVVQVCIFRLKCAGIHACCLHGSFLRYQSLA